MPKTGTATAGVVAVGSSEGNRPSRPDGEAGSSCAFYFDDQGNAGSHVQFGKNRNVAQDMLTRLEAERKTYQKSVAAFNVTYTDLMAKGQELLAALNDERIEEILAHDREFIQGAWTTAACGRTFKAFSATSRRRSRNTQLCREAQRIGRTYVPAVP
jgi:hypothetical protein